MQHYCYNSTHASTVYVFCSCLYRETKEECGLVVSNLDKVGVIMFEFVGEPQLMEVHVFRTETFTGEPYETEGELCVMCKGTLPKVYPGLPSH